MSLSGKASEPHVLKALWQTFNQFEDYVFLEEEGSFKQFIIEWKIRFHIIKLNNEIVLPLLFFFSEQLFLIVITFLYLIKGRVFPPQY